MNLLYVTPVGERGGMEVVLLNLIRALDRSRFTPVVAFLQPGPFVEEVEHAGVEVHVLDAGRVRNVRRGTRTVAQLAGLIRRRRVALVHTLNAKAHLYGGLAAAVARVPCLYHLHGVPTPGPSRDGVVSLLSVLVPAARTVACSKYVADRFEEIWRPRRRVMVIHNGLPTGPVTLDGEDGDVRTELGIPDGAPLVVMACRLQRWKGVHLFVDAAARVSRSCPRARFAVVGGTLFGLEANYARELAEQAEGLGLGDSLHFTGHRADVTRLLAAADVVVHASIQPDPFPTVILEAMACGTPVVASDLGGPREMIQDGITGVLIPPNSPERLAVAILELLRRPEHGARIGDAAALRVRSEFTAERMARRFEALYEELAVRGSSRGG